MSGGVEGVALLPCPNPWCEGAEGVEASQHIVSGKWHICCDDCMIESPWADSHALAIAAWNTRTTPPARSYADGVRDAAAVVDAEYDLRKHHHAANKAAGNKKEARDFETMMIAHTQSAAAIRLLSQGEKV